VLAGKFEPKKMIGKFHPGLNYDINTWQSNPKCGVFPCVE
jgi:hypothetical protein